MPVALGSALLSAYLNLYHFDWVHRVWQNPFPYQIFGYIVGFIVVFRAQWAHERYIAGRNNLQTMTARWADACAQALSFDEHTQPRDAGPEWRRTADAFQGSLVHCCSLMQALALSHLRGDWELDNIHAHDHNGPPPPMDAKYVAQSKYKRYAVYDFLFLRASKRARTAFNEATPLGVIGDLTGSELDYLTRRCDTRKAPQVVHGGGLFSGPKESAGVYHPGPGERVNVVLGWIYASLSARRHAGGLAIDAPVLANVWSRLADGYQAFEQCRMLSDTPFPWPWAQLLMLFLIAYAVSLPIMVTAFVDDVWVVSGLTFIAVLTYWSTNEVARDLEDPFLYDPNDLPAATTQYLFNERLLQSAAGILHDKPEYPEAVIPAEVPREARNFELALRRRQRRRHLKAEAEEDNPLQEALLAEAGNQLADDV